MAGLEHLAVFLQHHFDRCGVLTCGFDIAVAPLEDFGGEALKAAHRNGLMATFEFPLLQQISQAALAIGQRGDLRFGIELFVVEHHWCHHQAHGLHKAEPFEVGLDAGSAVSHELSPPCEIGHR